MGQRAGQIVRQKFGWSGVAKRFAEICEATLQDYTSSEVIQQAV
jgi:hypothetical protein